MHEGGERSITSVNCLILPHADKQPAAASEPHSVRQRRKSARCSGCRQTPEEVRAVASALRYVHRVLSPLTEAFKGIYTPSVFDLRFQNIDLHLKLCIDSETVKNISPHQKHFLQNDFAK